VSGKETLQEIVCMTENPNTQAIIVKTSRGLSIAGTRITLYQVMDYVKAGWPPEHRHIPINLTRVGGTENRP
jgi:uncharacterized protein (DUF433 family)